MSLCSDAENAASQTANDLDTAPVPRADGTSNVDNEQGAIEDLGARVIGGAHVILNRYLYHPERLYFLGDEKMSRPIASDWGALSRG